MTPQMTQVLANGPLFGRLPANVRKCLLAKAQPRSYDRGATICLQGEQAGTLKLVLDGWIKLYRNSSAGDEALLATLEAGESFDEVAALQHGVSQASAEAVSACTILHLDLKSICSCSNAKAAIQDAVLDASAYHMNGMMEQIEQLKIQTGTQRLTKFLMRLQTQESGVVELELPFEKTILAGKLGMKPESLSRAFSRLKQVGVSSEYRNVRIEDISALRALSEDIAA
ncbi:Crp/Fnr family transcriptional regulator [uncultured Pelagimonas sp.]|uniref:Crp/Fnr family transcriptional regulator n=1 Tax=uncultured Pelagimonas sp. TaxID=1618102 RepID=UPI00261641DA|nr:Crp/Fnr family transcriptional regulator [uncultured Pelagimonas sp.]